jgi:protocatechuate 3,4-dioxygenase beta subunit
LTLLTICGALPKGISFAAPVEQSTAPGPTQVGATTMCVLTPEQTEGPYYLDVGLLRSDITEGKAGVPLRLDLTTLQASSCQPIQGATVEIWHCDAAGDYSGFSGALPTMQGEPPGSNSGNPPPAPGGAGGPPPGGPRGPAAGGGAPAQNTPSNDLVFLRGGQVSDTGGLVTFQTIYPGWYRGRTVHIHIKVHVGGQEVHTSQLFFDDALSDQIFAQPTYAAHPNRDTRNATDNIFQSGGQQGLLTITPSDTGYTGTLSLGVQV